MRFVERPWHSLPGPRPSAPWRLLRDGALANPCGCRCGITQHAQHAQHSKQSRASASVCAETRGGRDDARRVPGLCAMSAPREALLRPGWRRRARQTGGLGGERGAYGRSAE